MLEFKDEFFEDEVLEGFYVPSMIKRCWAVELEVLYEFDRICRKHNIMYFADWGTLLAAIRHGGMMPWDDDIDVVMSRNEFERFYAVASDELPKEYHFIRFETTETCWQFIINLMSNSKMCFDLDYMDRHYGFPYMAGIDIFIMDHYCPDEEEAKDWRDTIKKILVTADLIWEGRITEEESEQELLKIEELTGAKLKRDGSLYERRLELYILARNECAKYNGETTKYVSQMLPWGIFQDIYHPREEYEQAIRVPFENMEISVPVLYHKLLTEKYHNYYMVYKNGFSAHGYPYFEGQRKALGENLDFVPQFRFSAGMFLDKGEMRMPLLKRYSIEYRDYFKQFSAYFRTVKDVNRISRDRLIECQNRAITYGQYLEEVKGEGFPIVRILERYCEAVYQLSEAVARNAPSGRIDDSAQKVIDDICGITDELEESIRKNILERSFVVFILYKAKYWNVFYPIWKSAKEDPQCDVSVVLSPLYYKKYDGTPLYSCRNQMGYPEEAVLTPYAELDLEKTGADVIYFQNPYDNYNMAVDMPPELYSSNLKKYCKLLVYIPYFREEDFAETDEKQYYNMKYYCTMPGVVNADRILLASEALKKVYVQKLCDFAGEDTREVWEEKISVMGNGLYEPGSKKAAAKKLFEQGLSLHPGKWVVYYTSISSLYEKKEAALRKVEYVLESLYRHIDNLSFIWVLDPAIGQYLRGLEPALTERLYKIADRYKSYGKVIQTFEQADLLADFCDAYYGDPSVLMQKFVNLSKPVMLCNYDI